MPMEAIQAQAVAIVAMLAGVLYGMEVITGVLPAVAAVVPVASAAQPATSVRVAPAAVAAVAVPAVALIGKILVIIMHVPLAAKAVKMLMEVTLPRVKKPR
jgi:hypothetical protein